MIKMRDEIKKEDVVALFLFYDFNKKYLENKTIDNIWEDIGYWRYNMNIDVEVLIQRTTDNRQRSSMFHVQIDRIRRKSLSCTINGQTYEVMLSQNGGDINNTKDYSNTENKNSDLEYHSPMPGKVIKVNVKEGDEVKVDDVLCVVEAMKMENNIKAMTSGKVAKVFVKENDKVDVKTILIELAL